MGAALALRLWRLDVALWYDEAFSAWLANLPLGRLIEAAACDVHPPGYYLVLWLVNYALGDSEAALRFPSVIAGILLIYVVYRLAMAMGLERRAVWLATAIAALAPFQVYYSQEARAYSMLMLAVTGAALGLVERRWWLAVASSLAGLYLNNLAPIFVGAVWLAGLMYHRNKPRPIITAAMVVGLGYLPGLIFALQQIGSVSSGYWKPPLNSPGRILATLDDLLWFTPNNPFVLATGLLTVMGLIMLIYDLRFTIYDLEKQFLWLAAGLPLGVVALVSVLWQPVLISRAVAPVAPFYYLLLGAAITRTPRRMWAWVGLAVPTAALILVGPLWGNVGRPTGDEKLLSLYGKYQPGDGIYHANVGSYVVWQYYHPQIPQYLWPQNTTIQQTLSAKTRQAMGMGEADFEMIKCRARRWWLITFNNPTTNQAEIDYIKTLVQQYNGHKIALLRQDTTVDAWLYRIEPDCEKK